MCCWCTALQVSESMRIPGSPPVIYSNSFPHQHADLVISGFVFCGAQCAATVCCHSVLPDLSLICSMKLRFVPNHLAGQQHPTYHVTCLTTECSYDPHLLNPVSPTAQSAAWKNILCDKKRPCVQPASLWMDGTWSLWGFPAVPDLGVFCSVAARKDPEIIPLATQIVNIQGGKTTIFWIQKF